MVTSTPGTFCSSKRSMPGVIPISPIFEWLHEKKTRIEQTIGLIAMASISPLLVKLKNRTVFRQRATEKQLAGLRPPHPTLSPRTVAAERAVVSSSLMRLFWGRGKCGKSFIGHPSGWWALEDLEHVSIGVDEVAHSAATDCVHFVTRPLHALFVQQGLSLFEVAHADRQVRPAGSSMWFRSGRGVSSRGMTSSSGAVVSAEDPDGFVVAK